MQYAEARVAQPPQKMLQFLIENLCTKLDMHNDA